jgi:hypothetical protein
MSTRLLATGIVLVSALYADRVPVRSPLAPFKGTVVLRDTSNTIIASGEVSQQLNGSKATATLSLRFKDGSVHQETAVFSHRQVFQLISYRLTQKGRSFKRPTDLSLNASTGQVTIHYVDDGAEKNIVDHLKLPPDVSNGLISAILCDANPATPKTKVSMVVSTPKPRIVGLEITPRGEESITVSDAVQKATRYNITIDIGGLAGAVAPIAGKQPPDTHVWISAGKSRSFLRSEGPLCEGCPVWRLEATSVPGADASH